MKPIDRFLRKPKPFWASVRTLSQEIGYSKGNTIIVPSANDIYRAFESLELDPARIIADKKPTQLTEELIDYFAERAAALEKGAQPNLMDADQAKAFFQKVYADIKPKCPIPMNKQKGEKKAEAYLTGLVNMMIEKNAKGHPCDYDPRKLTTITFDGAPLRTLARRIDGAFPSVVNPIAVWEIKEYYYSTTFGSRVADGVYETLLDGMELEELRMHENVDVKHYLMADSHYTWWKCGKAYLCRMFDMLHMGYVDEILFGKEVISELPRIVSEWVAILEKDQRK